MSNDKNRLGILTSLLIGLVTHAPVEAQEEIDWQPYLFQAFDGSEVQAELGRLEVQENRLDPESRQIEIAFVRFASTATEPGPPIFYLAGGPGGSGIDTARGRRFPLFMALRQFGDVLAIDQRGVGLSTPKLRCRQSLDLPLDRPADATDYLAEYQRQAAACAASMVNKGIDLNGYDSEQSADDLDDLRAALAAEEIVLWGTSYGTHLALATIRRHGPFVAAAVLHGVEGPDHTYKLPKTIDKTLKKVSKLIRKDPVVGSAMPDFYGKIQELILQFEDEGVSAPAVDPDTGEPIQIPLSGFEMRRLIATTVGSREDFAVLPALVQLAETGDLSAIGEALLQMRRASLFSAMSFAMDCASGVSAKRWRKILSQEKKFFFGRTIDFPNPDLCATWGVEDLGDSYRSRLQSDVPALLISGSLDGRTPFANAKEVGKGFADIRQLTIVGGSHDSLFVSDPGILEAIEDFLAGRPQGVKRIVLPPIEFQISP